MAKTYKTVRVVRKVWDGKSGHDRKINSEVSAHARKGYEVESITPGSGETVIVFKKRA